MLTTTTAHPPLRLAICGGGASAVLLLASLARHTRRALAVTVFEPRLRLGPGTAYATESPLHLLNVPAARMTTSEDPEGFLRWLRAERPRGDRDWSGEDFAPRALYGEYLERLCERARAAPHLKVTRARTLVQRVLPRGDDWEIVPERGPPVRADVVVLATGNEPPAPIAACADPAARPLLIENPWDPRSLDGLAPHAPVLLVGTGLTAIDVALELLYARGHSGQVLACSRRGLLPRPHGPRAALPEPLCRRLESASPRAIVRLARELAAQDATGARWRGLLDELRRTAPALWGRLSPREKGRFLEHLRPFWEVHRHRLAPEVHARLEAAMRAGAFEALRGRIEAIEAVPGPELLVRLRRTGAGERTLRVARVINCTGPRPGLRHSTNPLLRSLHAGGVAVQDDFGLGLATDSASRALGPDGRAYPTLFALGALARGHRFELTAIPEIAEQARSVAGQIVALRRVADAEDCASQYAPRGPRLAAPAHRADIVAPS